MSQAKPSASRTLSFPPTRSLRSKRDGAARGGPGGPRRPARQLRADYGHARSLVGLLFRPVEDSTMASYLARHAASGKRD